MSKNTFYKIEIDSNIFRNQDFINWLILKKEALSLEISVIVYLETLFWYLTRNLSVEDFEKDLQELNIAVISFDTELAQSTAKKAKKSRLSFRHHARDFIIGTTALRNKSILLTYNIRNFTWMPSDMVETPESFLEKHLDLFQE